MIDFQRLLELFVYDKYDPLLFSTVLFLFLFFFVLLIYRGLAKLPKGRVVFLILFSLFFYYKVVGEFFLLLVAVGVVNYFFGRWLGAIQEHRGRSAVVWLSVAFNIGLLAYFKYTNFMLESFASLASGSFDALDIFLPIGISFYSFKALSYIFDIYYETTEPVKSFSDFLLYIVFFPNILAGPIDRAPEFIPQIHQPYELTRAQTGKAVAFLISGLFKKSIIADYIGLNFIDRVFDVPLRFTGVENLLAVYGYALQIYCDFSGYTDMALGIALLLGFKLIDNFNFPYKATSIADFWRRWHISLSRWLLEYLFTPLQMKYRKWRNYGTALALFITFVLCGLWHGASWTFVFWGALHGFLMVSSILTKKPRQKVIKALKLKGTTLLKVIQVFITFHLLAFTWVFFRASSFENALNVLSQIFSYFHPEVFPQFIEGFPAVSLLIVIGYMIMFFPQKVAGKVETIMKNLPIPAQAALLSIMIYIVSQVRFADIAPFIYFQF